MQVVWSGTLERQAIEAERRPAPEIVTPRASWRQGSVAARVAMTLQQSGPLTGADIAARTGIKGANVRVALGTLRQGGLVERMETGVKRDLGHGRGRIARFYRWSGAD